MFVDYKKLKEKIIGRSIPKPLSGTLSGHSAGEPFDKLAYEIIKEMFTENAFRQYEYLNFLFTKNLDAKSRAEKEQLFDSPTVLFLLSRGKNATDKWSVENLFEEKQNDTADILVVKDGKYEIIDIKTRNISKYAQAPNIISAYKLAQLCAKILDNKDFETFTINYFEINWILENDELVCKDAFSANIFKANPENLYINWAAAMQIQFHVCDLDQSFNGNMKVWAKSYLKHFVTQAKKRADDMLKRFVKPFEKYIKD